MPLLHIFKHARNDAATAARRSRDDNLSVGIFFRYRKRISAYQSAFFGFAQFIAFLFEKKSSCFSCDFETAVKNASWLLATAGEGDAAVDAVALQEAVETARAAFIQAMDDDFNAPEALGSVFTLVGELNAAVAGKTLAKADVPAVTAARDEVVDLMACFGIDVAPGEQDLSATYPEEVVELAGTIAGYAGADKGEAVEALLEARARARKEKDWALADGVRDGLAALGFTIEDTPQGARVSYGA